MAHRNETFRNERIELHGHEIPTAVPHTVDHSLD